MDEFNKGKDIIHEFENDDFYLNEINYLLDRLKYLPEISYETAEKILFKLHQKDDWHSILALKYINLSNYQNTVNLLKLFSNFPIIKGIFSEMENISNNNIVLQKKIKELEKELDDLQKDSIGGFDVDFEYMYNEEHKENSKLKLIINEKDEIINNLRSKQNNGWIGGIFRRSQKQEIEVDSVVNFMNDNHYFIKATGSSIVKDVPMFKPENVLDNKNKYCFWSSSQPDSWLELEFPYTIIGSSYTIHAWTTMQPLKWEIKVFENNNWILVDSQSSSNLASTGSFTASFSQKHIFNKIRFIQTGPNSKGNECLVIKSFDVSGTILK